MKKDSFILSLPDLEERLDRLLVKRYPQCSRTYIQHLIDNEFVTINGSPAKKREKRELGSLIEICFPAKPPSHLEKEHLPLDLLYEDEDLLVINKPAGIVVHPGAGHPQGTLANRVAAHLDSTDWAEDPLRPGIVHRLDKDTSGLLLVAKTPKAHEALSEAFSNRLIIKHYLAVCAGNPADQTLRFPIGRHPIHRERMAIRETGGREAITHIRSISRSKELSLLEIKIDTGRTHQIRIHLSHIKAPVIGDALYGYEGTNRRYGASRQLLHAYRLDLAHPITKAPMSLQAPLPEDFAHFIANQALTIN